MSEPTDLPPTTQAKRTRSPRGQSARGTKKAMQTAATPPLASGDQEHQLALTQTELAISTAPSMVPQSQLAPGTKKESQQAMTTSRPVTDDRDQWKEHWAAKGQPWRTEPEVGVDQQRFLAERRAITPNIENGIYPFKGIKLSRADVGWLLATHEAGRGPVDWTDEHQHKRRGLDLLISA